MYYHLSEKIRKFFLQPNLAFRCAIQIQSLFINKQQSYYVVVVTVYKFVIKTISEHTLCNYTYYMIFTVSVFINSCNICKLLYSALQKDFFFLFGENRTFVTSQKEQRSTDVNGTFPHRGYKSFQDRKSVV